MLTAAPTAQDIYRFFFIICRRCGLKREPAIWLISERINKKNLLLFFTKKNVQARAFQSQIMCCISALNSIDSFFPLLLLLTSSGNEREKNFICSINATSRSAQKKSILIKSERARSLWFQNFFWDYIVKKSTSHLPCYRHNCPHRAKK